MDASIEHGYLIGLDLGKQNDFTAISVHRIRERVEVVSEQDQQRHLEGWLSGHLRRQAMPRVGQPKQGGARSMYFECVHLDRLPLGTSYPGVVEHIKELMWKPPLRGSAKLIVDATGVGLAVIDMMVKEGLKPIPITITAGNTVAVSGRGYTVPKIHLVDNLAVLLQSGRLAFANDLKFAQVLRDELLSFEAHRTPSGNETYNAREGAHDDLVLSVAIAVWYGVRKPPVHAADWRTLSY